MIVNNYHSYWLDARGTVFPPLNAKASDISEQVNSFFLDLNFQGKMKSKREYFHMLFVCLWVMGELLTKYQRV